MPNKVIITTDSTVDLLPVQIKENNIHVFNLFVEMDEKVYPDDGHTIVPEDLYKYYERTGKISRSSACNSEDYRGFFKEKVDEGYDIVHIGLSSKISCTFNNARIAAEEFDNVFAVDSAELSTGIALLVLRAAEMAKEGVAAAEIAEKIDDLKKYVDTSFVLDTLEYMHAGGRCSGVAKFGANLLKLRPVIQMKDGEMGVAKKLRGKIEDVYLDYVDFKLSETDDIDPARIFITSSGAISEEMMAKIVERVKSKLDFKEVIVTHAGCTISAHCGPGCYGVLFIRKTPLK